ncbi:MAG: hypothetical protein ABR611_12845 [Chthoniobacterales bacterium]
MKGAFGNEGALRILGQSKFLISELTGFLLFANQLGQMKTDLKNKETELVERALKICRAKYAIAVGRRAELNKEIEFLEGKIRNYEQLTASSADSALAPNSSIDRKKRTPRGRIPHNHCELLFVNFLRAREGVGATLKELIELTGASVATGYRAIGKLEREKKVKQDNDAHWHWIKK